MPIVERGIGPDQARGGEPAEQHRLLQQRGAPAGPRRLHGGGDAGDAAPADEDIVCAIMGCHGLSLLLDQPQHGGGRSQSPGVSFSRRGVRALRRKLPLPLAGR